MYLILDHIASTKAGKSYVYPTPPRNTKTSIALASTNPVSSPETSDTAGLVNKEADERPHDSSIPTIVKADGILLVITYLLIF